MFVVKWEDKQEDIEAFKRSSSAGSFEVLNVSVSSIDILPPSRIQDLAVSNTSIGDQLCTLTWTATGDDYDIGKGNTFCYFQFFYTIYHWTTGTHRVNQLSILHFQGCNNGIVNCYVGSTPFPIYNFNIHYLCYYTRCPLKFYLCLTINIGMKKQYFLKL